MKEFLFCPQDSSGKQKSDDTQFKHFHFRFYCMRKESPCVFDI